MRLVLTLVLTLLASGCFYALDGSLVQRKSDGGDAGLHDGRAEQTTQDVTDLGPPTETSPVDGSSPDL